LIVFFGLKQDAADVSQGQRCLTRHADLFGPGGGWNLKRSNMPLTGPKPERRHSCEGRHAERHTNGAQVKTVCGPPIPGDALLDSIENAGRTPFGAELAR
jgi:hypothetical protein